MKRMKIDALCSTGHKWMLSGYGSGFVYISRELLAETKPRAIGWLSVEDPYGDRNAEINLRTTHPREPSWVAHILPACSHWVLRLIF